jgi:alkylation response protein AidB-like acyl-CoA dehydrogenase
MTPEAFINPAELQQLRAETARTMAAGRAAARLPDSLHRLLLDLRLYRLWIPARYGGLELPLSAALATYVAVATLDAALGWSVMIGAGGGLFGAFLPPATAAKLFTPRAALVAGSGAVGGTATVSGGGFHATGRWRYASGADHATVFTANCATGRGVLALAFDPADVQIERAWNTSGLRATGSHDIVIARAFVADSATFTLDPGAAHEPGALYRIPFGVLTELPVTAVALGAAECAVRNFQVLAAVKPLHGSQRVLATHASVQATLQSAQSRLAAVRAGLFALAGEIWQAAEGGAVAGSLEQRCTAACVYWVRELLQATAGLVPLTGMNAIHEDDPFAIAWRDLQAVTAHYSVAPLAIDA